MLLYPQFACDVVKLRQFMNFLFDTFPIVILVPKADVIFSISLVVNHAFLKYLCDIKKQSKIFPSMLE